VTLTPKTVAAVASYTRRLLINSVPSIENIVRNDLAAIVANAIDAAALAGTGMSNQPTGVIAQSDVAEVTLASLTWEKMLEFVSTVQHADADMGNLGWALNAHAVKKLRSTTRVADEGAAGFIMESPTALAGYPVAVTSALPGDPNSSPAEAATVIFGAWSQLLVGYWSGTDILVNPYESTAYQKGRVLVRVMRDCDIAVRHGQSFAYADDLAVTTGE
jgi:HK97 family phage major capsid protein